jgi:hypothetical protein
MSDAHVSGAEFPHGVTAPMPVMTTRRGWEGDALFMRKGTGFLEDRRVRSETQNPPPKGADHKQDNSAKSGFSTIAMGALPEIPLRLETADLLLAIH